MNQIHILHGHWALVGLPLYGQAMLVHVVYVAKAGGQGANSCRWLGIEVPLFHCLVFDIGSML